MFHQTWHCMHNHYFSANIPLLASCFYHHDGNQKIISQAGIEFLWHIDGSTFCFWETDWNGLTANPSNPYLFQNAFPIRRFERFHVAKFGHVLLICVASFAIIAISEQISEIRNGIWSPNCDLSFTLWDRIGFWQNLGIQKAKILGFQTAQKSSNPMRSDGVTA